ncbi:MAG: Gfo/Idh/MocA family oxidoreductase [Gemmatimonadota bacterium]|nr:Gfo/Idh/MocA family oxidoreductase [Gemmatimonadota bacterium]
MRSQRVAVWGLGGHAIRNILPALAATNGVELYGVCSRTESTVGSCAQKWNCKGWTEPEPMLIDKNVDIIFLATPIGLHFEHGMRVLAAAKHFWCEKPLTCRLTDTLELLELSRSKRVSVCEGHMYLHHPQFRRILDYVRGGSVGRVVSIGCRFGIPRLEQETFRSDPLRGGGALFDVGCYPVSAIEALFPDQQMEVSYAVIGTREGSAVDTDGHAIIALSNAVRVHLEWRINCAYRNEIDIWGEKGSIFSDKVFSKSPDHVPEFRLRNAQGVEKTEYGSTGDHFSLMLQYFLGTVSDMESAEEERSRIARRAEVLERIARGAGYPVNRRQGE